MIDWIAYIVLTLGGVALAAGTVAAIIDSLLIRVLLSALVFIGLMMWAAERVLS